MLLWPLPTTGPKLAGQQHSQEAVLRVFTISHTLRGLRKCRHVTPAVWNRSEAVLHDMLHVHDQQQPGCCPAGSSNRLSCPWCPACPLPSKRPALHRVHCRCLLSLCMCAAKPAASCTQHSGSAHHHKMPQTPNSQKTHLSLLGPCEQDFTCTMLATAEQIPCCHVAVDLGCRNAHVHAQSCKKWCAKVMHLHFRKSALQPYQHAMQISGCMHFRATSSSLAHCTTLQCML